MLALAAELLRAEVPVDAVCADYVPGGTGRVVRRLVERYLVHAVTAPALHGDLRYIYGLALLFGGGQDADVLRALWDEEGVSRRLDELTARHDSVLTEGRRLHQDVRDAVRAYLVDPYRRADAGEANRRAAGPPGRG